MTGRKRLPKSSLRFLVAICAVLACVPQELATRPEVVAPAVEPRPSTPRTEPSIVVERGPEMVDAGPPQIRVGLATDLAELSLPCCDRRLELVAGEQRWPLTAPVRLSPAHALAAKPVYRLQVAALKDERQAHGVAAYLAETTGEPADVVFDAGTDLYKVRYGRFASREDAEAALAGLAGLGLTQAWVTSDGPQLVDPGFQVLEGKKRRFVPGRWMAVEAPPGLGISFPGGRYRGRILIHLNDRSRLNVINELDLEEYLRGVVPEEMGPELFNQLEALKAQAVAARTYAVRNLGEFSAEGYDICSTPHCQVYGGMNVEHPDSDRAVAETAGLVVLFDDEPAETFYGATCGGHTENVEVIFPLKRGDYLRGVPCMEAGLNQIGGDLRSGVSFPEGLLERLLPSSSGPAHLALSARLEHLALLAGLPIPRDQLRSVESGEVRRFLASVFDLALDPRMLRGNLARLVEKPPPEWKERDLELATYLAKSGLFEERPGKLGAGERAQLLYHLALYLGVLRREETHFLAIEERTLRLRTSMAVAYELPVRLATFRRNGRGLSSAPLDLAAGDRLELYWYSEDLLALVQPVEAQAVSLDRHAPKQRWTRFMSHSRLKNAVQTRYPGFPFEGFEVLTRGVSGRVGKLQLLGSGGRKVLVEGLAIRWTLDIPDTWFYASRHQSADRQPGWLFRGRGWGHGVGMCQAGAYGMASRHLGYRDILEHYYSGVELGRVRQVRPHPLEGP